MTSSTILSNWRQIAAEASQGISSGPIYSTFIKTVDENNLSGDLLDFGAGTGNLARQLQRLNRFRSITGVDILPRPETIDQTVRWITWDLNEKIDLPNATFDVIVSAEVIEHLENPRAIAREWVRLLRPGGTLIFSTPNNESWRSILALLLQGHFVYFGKSSYPAHITALLRQDIRYILQEAGFSQPKFIFTNVGRVPKLTRFYWQQLSGGLLKGSRYSDNLLAIAQKPMTTPANQEMKSTL
ncbi:MAG: methyltransferase domain-containing protein [Anaerolineae bacterium]|nr:methyltransferase domain-containing protein [Anaerolineae bacterium]